MLGVFNKYGAVVAEPYVCVGKYVEGYFGEVNFGVLEESGGFLFGLQVGLE
jgi:hypothetical protein